MKPYVYEPVSPYVDIQTGEPADTGDGRNVLIVACELDRCIVIGHKPYTCSVCGIKVGLSPSSQALIEQSPKSTIICMACLTKQCSPVEES
jgi:hypothetical protein